MKRASICLLLSLITLLAMSYEAFAQSTSPSASARPGPEQLLEELVKEVRQLRAEVHRLGIAAYKGQVLVENLRIQQAQVNRISRELSEVRERIEETRVKQQKLKALIERMEKEFETGMKSGEGMSEMKDELEAVKKSEHRLIEQESLLTSDLNVQRMKLAELEERLNAIDKELVGK